MLEAGFSNRVFESKLEKDRLAAWWEAKEAATKANIKQSTPEFENFWRKWLTDKNLILYPEF